MAGSQAHIVPVCMQRLAQQCAQIVSNIDPNTFFKITFFVFLLCILCLDFQMVYRAQADWSKCLFYTLLIDLIKIICTVESVKV